MKRNTYRRNLFIVNKIDICQVLFYRENHQHHISSYSFSFSASVVRTRLGSWAASGSQLCQQRLHFVAFIAWILACWSHKIRPRHHVFRSRRPQFHRNPWRHNSPVLPRKCSENSRFSPKSGLIWWGLRGFEGGWKQKNSPPLQWVLWSWSLVFFHYSLVYGIVPLNKVFFYWFTDLNIVVIEPDVRYLFVP